MIHKYYCMDCGLEQDGENFNVDLAELLGLRDTSVQGTKGSRETQVSIEELRKLAEETPGQGPLKDGEISEVRLTLFQFLDYMAQSIEGLAGSELQKMQAGWKHSSLAGNLAGLLQSSESAEVADEMANFLAQSLEGRFTYSDPPDAISDDELLKMSESEQMEYSAKLDEALEDLNNYSASFYIKPSFFKDSDKIYTVYYSSERNTPNYRSMMAEGAEIRGYCPNRSCGKPILKGTGKYPHILVGMLGAQSAGKTTTIVAMLDEMERYYDELGVSFPETNLGDSKTQVRRHNRDLYQHGWSVVKTDAQSNIASFNASILIDDPSRERGENGETEKKLVSLVDIAGELCWDDAAQRVNPNAWQTYPLITSCDVYILCTCMDAEGYGNAGKVVDASGAQVQSTGGASTKISPTAVLQICKSIYAHHTKEKEMDIPPLCILLTKADLAVVEGTNAVDVKSPFEQIYPEDTDRYQYLDELKNLKKFYEDYSQDNVRIPLEYCCKTFNEMKGRTYATMLFCSAQGRSADPYPKEGVTVTEYAQPAFRRSGLLDLWKWILQAAGVVSAEKETGWYFRTVPSYTESYVDDGEELKPEETPRRVYTISESEARIHAVQNLFLNMSELDHQILEEWEAGEVKSGFFGKKTTPEERIRQLISG